MSGDQVEGTEMQMWGAGGGGLPWDISSGCTGEAERGIDLHSPRWHRPSGDRDIGDVGDGARDKDGDKDIGDVGDGASDKDRDKDIGDGDG